MKSKIRALTEGAMFAAIVASLLLIGRMFNAYMLIFILPVLLIVYGARYSARDTATLVGVLVILAFIVTGNIGVTAMVLMYGLVGLVYVYGYHHLYHRRKLFILVLIGTLLIYYVSVHLFAATFGIDQSFDEQMVRSIIDQLNTQLSSQGAALIDASDRFVNMILLMMYAVNAFMETFVITRLSLIALNYLKLRLPMRAPEALKPIPAGLAYGLLAIYVGEPLLIDRVDGPWAVKIILPIYLLSIIILGCYGFYFIEFVRKRYNLRYLWISLVILMIYFTRITMHIVVLGGFIDLASPLRKQISNGGRNDRKV